MTRAIKNKLESILEDALSFLGRITPDGATARLLEIDVNEVSFVDRAANKRRFISIKQHGDIMTVKKIELSKATKNGLLEILSKSLERMIVICDVVKSADVNDDAKIPEDLSASLIETNDALQSAVSMCADGEADVDDTAEKSAADHLNDIVKAIDEFAQHMQDKTINDDIASSIEKLSATLASMVKKEDADVAEKDAATDTETETKPETETEKECGSEGCTADAPNMTHVDSMSDEEFFEEFDKATAEIGGLGTEFSDKMRVLAQVMVRIADATDPVTLNQIRHEMIGSMKAAVQLKNKATSPSDDALKKMSEMFSNFAETLIGKRNMESQVALPERSDGDLGNIGTGPSGDEPAKDKEDDPLSDILKSKIRVLEEKVAKMSKIPQAPASRPDEQENNKRVSQPGTKTRRSRWVV